MRVRSPRPEVTQAENLRQLPFLLHGFSTRKGGVSEAYGGESLNLGITQEDSRENVSENRRIFLRAINAIKGRDTLPLVTARQIHSAVIHHITDVPKEPLTGDGLITNLPGVVLSVRTADCIPVLLADRKRKAIGAFHAGWRGTIGASRRGRVGSGVNERAPRGTSSDAGRAGAMTVKLIRSGGYCRRAGPTRSA